MLVFVAGCVAALALGVAVVRGRVELAIGIAVGLVIAGGVAAAAPAIHLKEIPVWLPPLPFALVAFTLFAFGALAWWWGTDR